MADKRSEAERSERILDAIGEYVESAPDEELLDEAREEGRDPVETTVRVKSILKSAVKAFQQRELHTARQAYEREAALAKSRLIQLPEKPAQRRRWLEAVFAQQPQLQPAFTWQNREFKDLTDEDIERHLRKMAELGVLKDVKLPNDDDD